MPFISAQNAVYQSVKEILPTFNFIFAHGNGHQPQTPYATIEVTQLDSIGNPEVSSQANSSGLTIYREVYEAIVKFEFEGKNSQTNNSGNDILNFCHAIASPQAGMVFRKNNLSFTRKGTIRRIPRFRDTVWYVAYVIDVVFSFCLETAQDVGTIEIVNIDGVIHSDVNGDPILSHIHFESEGNNLIIESGGSLLLADGINGLSLSST